jgi:hypothetical protein
MAAKDFTLSQEYLHQWFDYVDGNLYYKKSKSKIRIGQKAGWLSTTGYCRIKIQHIDYAAHRVIFMWHHGYLPEIIDHIDGNPANNKIENLRPTNQSWNAIYSKKRSNNTSGYKNISWHSQSKKWWVRVYINGKRKSLGLHKDLQNAVKVAKEARIANHGEFAHHG